MSKRSLLAILCALAVVPAALFAAGQTEAGGAGEKQIQILNGTNWPIPADVDVNDNQWTQVYEDAVGANIEWIIVPNSGLVEKKNVLIATGQVPDLFPVTDQEMVSFAEDGVIRPLDDLVDQHFQNQSEWFDRSTLSAAMYNGQQYRLLTPGFPLRNPRTLYVRQDWLDALSLPVPTTLDQVTETMMAFTFEDPDGNGEDDTFGYSGTANLGLMHWAFGPFGVNEDHWSEVSGEIVPDIIRPEMKEALLYIAGLYESGVYDRDSLLQANPQVEERVTAGYIGFTEFFSNGVENRINPALQETGALLAPIEPIAGPDGARMYPTAAAIWGRYGVSAVSEFPEVPVQIFSWLLQPNDDADGYISINADKINMGTVGVHSVLDPVNNYLLESGRDEIYRMSYRLMGGYVHVAPLEQLEGTVRNYDAIAAVAPYAHTSEKAVVGPLEAEGWSELKTYFDEVKMGIVTGNQPASAFDDWVEFFLANGGQEIIDEANANR